MNNSLLNYIAYDIIKVSISDERQSLYRYGLNNDLCISLISIFL